MKHATLTGDTARANQPSPGDAGPRGLAVAAPPGGLGFLERVQDGKVQLLRNGPVADESSIHRHAARGVAGPGGPLPHLDAIARSFGKYDVGGVVAHTGRAAIGAARAIGAEAYATGDHVAFAARPSLHTAAHEAAHVVQQRAGVHLAGGVGARGDEFERHADAVADRVVRGEPAESLLDRFAGPCAPVAAGGAPQIQRRDMRAVMIDQRARERQVGERVKAKSKDPGAYTTVGFEWDIAVTVDRVVGGDHPVDNVLQGLTHVELAESGNKWNGLPYFLETDAGNVLEFVTPPFYVQTAAPGTSLPDLADLQDIVDSTRESLKGVAEAKDTLGEVMTNAGWAKFAMGEWVANDLEVGWRNWSPRALSDEAIEDDLANWKDIPIKQATLEKQPQINIAVTAHDYGQAQGSGESRLGAKDEYAKAQATREKKLEDFVASPARKKLGSDVDQVARINLVLDQLVRVMAQQPIVAMIEELAGLQQRGITGENVANAFRGASGAPSYIKDSDAVWLKTDLFTFAASALRSEDWALLAGARGLLQVMRAALAKARLGEDVPVPAADAVLAALQTHANNLTNVAGSDAPARAKARQEYILAEFRRIGLAKPDFNEHAAGILGVRQDTFIKPEVMLKLSNRLGLGMLSVMEVRNTSDFVKWLATGKKSKSKSSAPEVVEAPPVPVGLLQPNVTAGDGNCFFHALYESINGARSSVPLQAAIRQSVVDALKLQDNICKSHFGPLGKDSPEFTHYAEEILAEGAWVSNQTPGIVSDALNYRITIHRPDGTVYYDAQPNAAFPRAHAPVTVHVMYTGNHYNSYTNPALP